MKLSDDDLRQVLRYRNRPERDMVMRKLGLDPKSKADHVKMYGVFRSIGDVVRRGTRCVFPGLGTFEWKPCRGRLPTGKAFKSRRLVFTLTRADRRK